MKKDTNFDSILAGAILAGLAEAAMKTESSEEEETATPPKTIHQEKAEELRALYNAFLEVGFDEDQATAFVCAILH